MQMVAIADLEVGMVIVQRVFHNHSLLYDQGTVLDRMKIETLFNLGYSMLLVSDQRGPGAQLNLPVEVQAEGTMIVAKVFEAAEKGALSAVRKIGDSSHLLELTDYVHKIINLLSQDTLIALNSLKDNSLYNFQHSVDVAVFAILFGKKLGFSDDRLVHLGVGAILHDIGKVYIPPVILNKTGSLTPSEREVVTEHPVHGYEMLKANENFNTIAGVLDIVRHHHERHSGGGYPEGLKGQGILWDPEQSAPTGLSVIHPMAQVITLCDVFDALTSKRPYRSAMSYPEALSLMSSEMVECFHPQLLERFIRSVNLYPVGSVIRVSSGRYKGYVGTVINSGIGLMEEMFSSRVRLFCDRQNRRVPPIIINLHQEEGGLAM